MITLKQFFETVNYRITEGSAFMWRCYGHNAYSLDSAINIDSWSEGSTAQITFDTETQTVYHVETHDYKNNRSYRLINPDYLEAYRAECVRRSVPFDIAYDQVHFTDLETVEDWLEKTQAIITGQDYDTRVTVPLDLDDGTLYDLMKAAHQEDMTLNQYVEKILRVVIAEHGEKTNDTSR